MSLFFICIAGPTGVGKSGLAVDLRNYLPIEIINCDSAQFYTPLAIGTAKPDWKNEPVAHHLFDYIDSPVDFSVKQYRQACQKIASDITQRGNIPVVVGGSSFYWYSLFFPPLQHVSEKDVESARLALKNQTTEYLWNELHTVDPERAKVVHQNDRYRIERALAIWKASGKKPSEFKPVFDPIGSCFFSFISRDRFDLYDRINRRTPLMFQEGWIDEVCDLSEEWKPFLLKKRFIGYPEIIDFCDGFSKISKKELMEKIAQQTRRYARKQEVFYRRFQEHVQKLEERQQELVSVRTINLSGMSLDAILEQMVEDIQGMRHAMDGEL